MARKTLGEKVDELEKFVAGILTQIRELERAIEDLGDAAAKNREGLTSLRLDSEKPLVGLSKDVEELRRWTEKNGISELKNESVLLKEKIFKLESAQEKIGTRAWSVVPNIVGAVISGVIAAIVAFLVVKYGKS